MIANDARELFAMLHNFDVLERLIHRNRHCPIICQNLFGDRFEAFSHFSAHAPEHTAKE